MTIHISKGIGFQNGRQFPFVKSPNIGGKLNPIYIVIHDTASGLKDDGDISWLTNRASKVSAHVVVGRDGKITQLVPFNVVAWHAGKSQWKGKQFLNSYAIGIEIDNPGKLEKVKEGVYKNSFCTIDTNKDRSLKVTYAKTAAHGAGYWLNYSPEQIANVKALCAAICEAYPIEDILTHWMISPGRKIDTNPTYPLDDLRGAVLGHRPVSFMPGLEDGDRTDTDESGENSGPVTERHDESEGGITKLRRFIRSKITHGFSGVSITSALAFLTDWRVVAAIGVFALLAYALWIWSQKK